MDTQVAAEDPTNDKWAVDFIKTHSSSKPDTIFEVHWKSGDIAWQPYYQITHLQVLMDYLDFLGVTWISNLPKGTRHPPADNPQIFLGLMTLYPTHDIFPFCSFSVSPILVIKDFFVNIFSSFLYSSSTFISITIDLKLSISMPKHCGINHPYFTQISTTHYSIQEPGNSLSCTLHIGQIADYLNFDEQLRFHKGLDCLQSMPLGFSKFSTLWNQGAQSMDTRYVSLVYILEDSAEYHIQLPSTPLTITKFFITAEQVSLAPISSTKTVQTEIMQEFASVMMEQHHNSHRGFERCQDWWLCQFNQGPSTNPEHVLSRLQFKEKRCWWSLTPAWWALSPVPPKETPEESPLNQPPPPPPIKSSEAIKMEAVKWIATTNAPTVWNDTKFTCSLLFLSFFSLSSDFIPFSSDLEGTCNSSYLLHQLYIFFIVLHLFLLHFSSSPPDTVDVDLYLPFLDYSLLLFLNPFIRFYS